MARTSKGKNHTLGDRQARTKKRSQIRDEVIEQQQQNKRVRQTLAEVEQGKDDDVEQQTEKDAEPESNKTSDGGSEAGEENASEHHTNAEQSTHKR